MATDEREERSRSTSDNTLKEERQNDQDAKQEKSEDDQGQEEKAEDGPPLPVGFFDSRLHKTRKEVAWKWLATSKPQ